MKIPNLNKLSKASQLSLLAIVILLGAMFFTINSALQEQSSSSRAAENTTSQYGITSCTGLFPFIHCVIPTLYPTPTSLPTPVPQKTNCIIRPTCMPGLFCPAYIGVGNCTPTPTPSPAPIPRATPTQTPTPTLGPTTCIIRPTCIAGEACPQYIGVGNCTPTATPIPEPTPTSIVYPTATSVPPTKQPVISNTPVPGDTLVAVTVGLDGIGTAGDRSAPNTDGNMDPLHPTRTITMTVFNSQNQQVASEQGSITYNTTTGQFDGTVDLGSQFTTGDYTVKIQTAQYLRGLLPGIQAITAGQTNTLPYVALIAGDINGDNQINILDYNILMGCYSDLLPAANCTSANNVLSDLNDDGSVNQFDYNLFLRELSNLGGD